MLRKSPAVTAAAVLTSEVGCRGRSGPPASASHAVPASSPKDPPRGTAAGAVSDALAELQCHVCLEALVLPEALPCGHLFCAECLAKWLRRQPSCPTCKSDVSDSKGVRVPAVEGAVRVLWETISPGMYDARARDARLNLEMYGLLSAPNLAKDKWTPPPLPAPNACHGRLLRAHSVLTPLRLREFALATEVQPSVNADWKHSAVDFELEHVRASQDWEPDEWCWTARIDVPAVASSSQVVGGNLSMPPRPLDLRLVVGSHNRVLDPGDDDDRFCLRLEADDSDFHPSGIPASGRSCWLHLQIILPVGEESVALPFVVAMGEPFPSAQVVQLAQSRGCAHAGASSLDSRWREWRRLLHSTAETLVKSGTGAVVSAVFRSGSHEPLPESVRRRRIEAVVSAKYAEYDVSALADHHSDLFARCEGGEVDYFSLPRFPRGFVQLPSPQRVNRAS